MAEWSNAPVLKTGVPRGTGGSNPSPSATRSFMGQLEHYFLNLLKTHQLEYRVLSKYCFVDLHLRHK